MVPWKINVRCSDCERRQRSKGEVDEQAARPAFMASLSQTPSQAHDGAAGVLR
jgi:hypothetical protein